MQLPDSFGNSKYYFKIILTRKKESENQKNISRWQWRARMLRVSVLSSYDDVISWWRHLRNPVGSKRPHRNTACSLPIYSYFNKLIKCLVFIMLNFFTSGFSGEIFWVSQIRFFSFGLTVTQKYCTHSIYNMLEFNTASPEVVGRDSGVPFSFSYFLGLFTAKLFKNVMNLKFRP